jgi:hypothetical protein
LTQVADAGHDIGLAAEEDAGRILVEGIEAGIGQRLRIVARRPREGVGRNAPINQLGMDGVERSAVEVDEMPLAIVLRALSAAAS